MLVAAVVGAAFVLAPGEHISAAGNISITRTFQPSSADTWLDQQNPTTADGSDTLLHVHSRGPAGNPRNRRSLVQFDISSIPSGSTVTSATLGLNLNTAPSSSRTHDVHRATSSWVETSVTWNTMPTFNATATASAATGTTSGAWISWTVTSDVSAYIGGTATNYGWLVKDQTENDSPEIMSHYESRESATTTIRPKLTVTFTAPWESYETSARTTIRDVFDSSYNTVYMKGTGFASGNYNVGYFDGTVSGGGDWIATDENILVAGDGILNSQYILNTNQGAAAGTWHALAQPFGATAFPATYDAAVAAPDTYKLIANDSFTAQASAIPEFPTVVAGIVVAGLCFGIYYWMRQRRAYGVYRVS